MKTLLFMALLLITATALALAERPDLTANQCKALRQLHIRCGNGEDRRHDEDSQPVPSSPKPSGGGGDGGGDGGSGGDGGGHPPGGGDGGNKPGPPDSGRGDGDGGGKPDGGSIEDGP